MISIHALLAESDRTGPLNTSTKRRFLSTLSLRRATMTTNISNLKVFYFYPRSPCGERLSSPVKSSNFGNFYPRSPCGERLVLLGKLTKLVKFLSTLSLRRATVIAVLHIIAGANFYPRSPCGERPSSARSYSQRSYRFLSTLSLRRATASDISILSR